MHHSFVIAKLLPHLPIWARHGRRVAPSLVTTPFLALHLQDTAPKNPFEFDRSANLFVISREKPVGKEYFVLNTTKADEIQGAGTLKFSHPLPFHYPLYLHVSPRIHAEFPILETYRRLVKGGEHQLDSLSVERLLKAIKEAGPSIPGVRETGGKEALGDEWDTWSGISPREAPGALVGGRFVPLSFEIVPFDTLPANWSAQVFEEIPLLRQLYLDYTWEGCGLVTDYIESMRKAVPRLTTSGRIFRSPPQPSDESRPLDSMAEALRPSLGPLQSLPVTHDGDPRVAEEDDIADDWKDVDVPVLKMEMANIVSAVKTEEVKVIVVDCINTLVDTDGPLQEALTTLFPPTVHQFSREELLEIYVERETLLQLDDQPHSAVEVIQEVARFLGTSVQDQSIRETLQHLSKPKLYEDAHSTVSELIREGYEVIALPGSDFGLLDQIPGLTLDFIRSSTEAPTWTSLSDYCKKSRRDILPSEILVVTSNLHGIVEPAGLAGLPTAFVRRPNNRSTRLDIPTVVPTFTVEAFGHLLPILRDFKSADCPPEPVTPSDMLPVRIRNCYQVISMLGYGSYSYVWNAVQLATGASVAIKFEVINPSEPSTIVYETAVYAQLEGVKGIPKVHWSGVDHNAQVLVMDKLGPNLEKLRRFCRGRFSLKTVLMLGEQMLSTIEHVHARGIIVRDIKPENFAMGLTEEYKQLHLLDMGLCKLYFDPSTGKHIPLREGRGGIGTPRYASHNVHFGLEPSRRDDVEAIGIVLLYLFHGRLPWQGICAPDIPSKLLRIGEMKRGKPFADLLSTSPAFFLLFFEHCRSLEFEGKPNYVHLRKLLRDAMNECGWEYDWEYDWFAPGERGTTLPSEYKFDAQFLEPLRYCQDIL